MIELGPEPVPLTLTLCFFYHSTITSNGVLRTGCLKMIAFYLCLIFILAYYSYLIIYI